MENIEHKFDQTTADAKKVALLPEEKERIRQNLLKFMQEYVPVPEVPAAKAWYAVFAPTKPLQYSYLSFASLLMIFFFGASVAFAAQQSLPGDLLYPVKTEITEKVLAWTMTSEEARAQYDIALVQLRLEEIEKVSAEKKLDQKASANVQRLLTNHIADIKSHVDTIEKEGQSDAGIEANSELEASLNAHTGLLEKLNVDAGIISNVKEKTSVLVKARQEGESKLNTQSAPALKVAAEKKLAQTAEHMRAATDLLESKKSAISAEAYDKAKADLNLAQENFNQATVKLTAQDYSNAFILFQNAMRIALQVEISVKTESNFKVPTGAIINNLLP